jgi:hypothetical protein
MQHLLRQSLLLDQLDQLLLRQHQLRLLGLSDQLILLVR